MEFYLYVCYNYPAMAEVNKKVISSNKKAYFDFTIFEKYEAGVVLTGTEIKAIRAGAINLKDSFIKIEEKNKFKRSKRGETRETGVVTNEAYLYNCHISPYDFGNRYNHDPRRVRKLLLHKKEILKILNKQKQENYTIVPLNAYLSKGYVKLEIALCKGKKLYDKREALKKKDISRNLKNY